MYACFACCYFRACVVFFFPKSKRWGPCFLQYRSRCSGIRRLRHPSSIAAPTTPIARSRRGETISAVGVLKSCVFAVSNAAPRARPAAERSHLRWNNEALALDHCSPKVQSASQCVDNRLRSSRVPSSRRRSPSRSYLCWNNEARISTPSAPTNAGTMRRPHWTTVA